MNDTERLDWLQKNDCDIYCRDGQVFELSVPDDDAEGPHDALVAQAGNIRDLIDSAIVKLTTV